jgi:transcriptional regulator with XRE-family HTH domain
MGLLFLDTDLTLGQRVRLSRIAKRWRQVDLAAIAGVEQHEVSQIELDRRLRPNAVKAICSALALDAGNE